MAHSITNTNGMNEMAYVGETPWHGLGQIMEPGAPIERWVEQAGMNWTIRKTPVMYYSGRSQTKLLKMDDKSVLSRSDNNAALGVVGSKYEIVQPFQVFEFFRDLVDDMGFEINTAGTLFGGSRFWVLAKIAEAKICGWDQIGAYMLLSTTADGSRATEARETSVRVVCNNTLSMAYNDNAPQNIVRVSHRQTWDDDKVKAKLGLGRKNFDAFLDAAAALAKAKVSNLVAADFVARVLRATPSDVAAEDLVLPNRAPKGFEAVMALFNGAGRGSTEKGSEGTAWGLVNAVTEYVDYHSTAISTDHRLDRALWGSGNDMKTKALQTAVTMFT